LAEAVVAAVEEKALARLMADLVVERTVFKPLALEL
jgi:hypothetical protein